MKDITLVNIGTVKHDLVKFSIETTLKNVNCKKILTFSDKPIHPDATFIKINPISNIKEYSYFVLKVLAPFVQTSHVLLIQYDSMAVKKEYWTDEFLEYDYLGAPFVGKKWVGHDDYCVGNGGFSLRSKKLLLALQDREIYLNENVYFGVNEDYIICLDNRQLLMKKYGINFAPKVLAAQFSNEYEERNDSFGFHGLWNLPRYLDKETIKMVYGKSFTSNFN